MKIRIAVIGLGRIGWSFHCLEIARHPQFQLAAVADPLPERCQEAESAFPGCRGFTDYIKMLDQVPLDAVVIAAPTHFHKEMALRAFSKKLHVFLEKPMAPNAREAEAIAQAAKKHRRILTVYQPYRAQALFQQALKEIRTGRIGEIIQVRRSMFRYVRRNDWQSLRKFGGGMLNNYGAHALDQILQLIGYDIRRCFCQLRKIASLGDAEDMVKVVLQTQSGKLGEADINQASTASPPEMEIFGTRGSIRMESDKLIVRYVKPRELTRKALDRSLASEGRKYPEDNVRIYEKEIAKDPAMEMDVYANLAKAIAKGTRPFVKPEETLALMRLLDQCRRDSGKIYKSS